MGIKPEDGCCKVLAPASLKLSENSLKEFGVEILGEYFVDIKGDGR